MQHHGLAERSGNLIRRILGSHEQPGVAAAAPRQVPAGAGARRWSDTVCRGRDEVLDTIKAFLREFDLDLTQANLNIAYAVVTGDNLHLRRKFAQMAEAGEVTADEIATLLAEDGAPGDDPFEEMAERLDKTVSRFSDTAKSARTAAEQHGQNLATEMGRFDARTITVDEFADWIETSQRILTATRDYESRLRSSEREAQGLRSELVKIRKLADIDPLTELPNRRGFEQLLEDELRKANEQVEQLVIAFCDIDHFKAINDNWGHETGDRVLRSVGQRFARMTDDKCHAARHGGEEFVMLFRGISAEEARQRIDEVRLSLSRTRFVNEAAGQAIGAVTFSGGVADVFAHDNPRDALGAADKALYRAKQSGRNRVLLEGEGEDAD